LFADLFVENNREKNRSSSSAIGSHLSFFFSASSSSCPQDKSSGIVFPAPILEPSSWIPKTAFEPVNTTKEPFRRIFVDMFTISGRVAHVSRVISLHPGFFDCYFSTLSFVMREPGPLQISWRWYIALLVRRGNVGGILLSLQASRHLSFLACM
jgi:hypothetical protein